MRAFFVLIAATAALSTAALTGCQNTAEGVAEDSQNAAQKTAEVAKEAGEATAQAAEKTGEVAAQAVNSATKDAKEVGKDIAGALQVTPLVKTALAADTEINDPKNKIDVDSKDGMVYLKGHVTSNTLKAKATKIAQDRIKENKGTDKVVNQLLVQP